MTFERQHEAGKLTAGSDFHQGASGVPGLAATRNSTRSKPCGEGLRRIGVDAGLEAGAFELERRQFPATA